MRWLYTDWKILENGVSVALGIGVEVLQLRGEGGGSQCIYIWFLCIYTLACESERFDAAFRAFLSVWAESLIFDPAELHFIKYKSIRVIRIRIRTYIIFLC